MTDNFVKVALVAEGDIERVVMINEKYLSAFADGFSWGGSFYGAGSCYVATFEELVQDNEDELARELNEAEPVSILDWK